MSPEQRAQYVAANLHYWAPEIRLRSLEEQYQRAGDQSREFLDALRRKLGGDLRRLLDQAVLAAAIEARRFTGELLEQGRCIQCGARHCCDEGSAAREGRS